ncbi:hypothetical protein MRB53_026866 [Persea americana]|uniref:Uncharacterized protein n=1 Tax=Persea americana TaxID=3435 RepID=A0ACC2LJU8_PERAE|nr:hypothetical protein MRB53_026866 [Persea americana]
MRTALFHVLFTVVLLPRHFCLQLTVAALGWATLLTGWAYVKKHNGRLLCVKLVTKVKFADLVSGQVFPLTPAEEQAVRGIRRKLEGESTDNCAFKRRRDTQLHPSPFEKSFSAVTPICSQVGDGMDMRSSNLLLWAIM